MSSKIIIPIVIGLVVIVGGIFFLQSSSSTSEVGGAPSGEREVSTQQVSEKDLVPDLTFKDFNGNDVSLRDFQGKPIIVNSWAAWCPFCIDELPDFAEVQKEFGDEIVIIAIDRAESLALAKSYTDELEVTDDILFLLDPKDTFYRAIFGFSMPETLFVDADGVVRDHKRGPMTADEIRERLQKIL